MSRSWVTVVVSSRFSLETDRSSGPARSTPLWITTVPARYFAGRAAAGPVVQAVSDGSVAVGDSNQLDSGRPCAPSWMQCRWCVAAVRGAGSAGVQDVCMYKYGCMYVYRWMRKVAGDDREHPSLPLSLLSVCLSVCLCPLVCLLCLVLSCLLVSLYALNPWRVRQCSSPRKTPGLRWV